MKHEEERGEGAPFRGLNDKRLYAAMIVMETGKIRKLLATTAVVAKELDSSRISSMAPTKETWDLVSGSDESSHSVSDWQDILVAGFITERASFLRTAAHLDSQSSHGFNTLAVRGTIGHERIIGPSILLA